MEPNGRRPGSPDRERARRSAIVIPAGRNAVASLRSLGGRGVHTIVVSELADEVASCSRYCGETVTTPSPATDLSGYKDALVSLAARPDVRTIAPLREADIYVLSKHVSEFEAHVATPWVRFDTLRKVHDRHHLATIASEVGIPVPKTQLLDEVDDWEPRQIVKPRYSVLTDAYVGSLSPGDGVRPRSIRYLEPGVEPDHDRIVAEMGHVPIVQRFVPVENEYGMGAICDRGEPLATFQHQKHRDHRYSGGASVFRESVRIPEIETAGRRLLEALDWHGIAQIQFMEDAETGAYTLTEINPRFWGSLSCAVRAGADFPYYYWLLATGDPDRIAPGYEVGVATHLVSGEVSYLLSIVRDGANPLVEKPALARATWEVATSFYTHPRFDSFTLDDPWPFLRRLRTAVLGR